MKVIPTLCACACLLIFPVKLYSQETTTQQTITEEVITVTDSAAVATDIPLPVKVGPVNDFEEIFTEQQVKLLEGIISKFEKKTGNQIAVASIQSIEPYKLFDEYALVLSNHWGVGTHKNNNGMTLMFSKSLRQLRVSTGTGTEKVLTDEECQIVIDEYIIPEFKKGNFYEGVKKGLEELIARWK